MRLNINTFFLSCQARSSQPKQSHQTHELQLQHTPKSPAGESGDPISVFSNQAVQAQSLAPTPPRTLPRRYARLIFLVKSVACV